MMSFAPELAESTDPYRNYCLWPYAPIASTVGAWRPVNLLRHSFEVAGAGAPHERLVERLRENLGIHAVVWGVKFVGGRLSWEFYFYDYERRERTVSLSRVLPIFQGTPADILSIDERIPYFMFSLDLEDSVLSRASTVEHAHIYIGNPTGNLSSGISYGLTRAGMRLENVYTFFDARRDLEGAAAKAACSAYFDSESVPIDEILIPELVDCDSICVANKSTHDTVYFSGVTTDQLIHFMERFGYPAPIVEFVTAHRSRFAPLLHDVGFDYRCDGTRIEVLKSGYYGVF
ncbi:MAG: hypothetical protein SFX72_17245 [Isosphaeraceae bacterium]|nr:hypothetical protein [Isosphaeraceae bacterium]